MPGLEVEVSLESGDVDVLGQDERHQQQHRQPERARVQQVVPHLQ